MSNLTIFLSWSLFFYIHEEHHGLHVYKLETKGLCTSLVECQLFSLLQVLSVLTTSNSMCYILEVKGLCIILVLIGSTDFKSINSNIKCFSLNTTLLYNLYYIQKVGHITLSHLNTFRLVVFSLRHD